MAPDSDELLGELGQVLIVVAAINEGRAACFAGPFPVHQSTLKLQADLGTPADFTRVSVTPTGWRVEDVCSPSPKRGKLREQEFAGLEHW